MYAGKNEPVPLPTTGHLHTLKTGYVYWEDDGKWDNERKQTVDGRVSIGRIDPDHKGMMFPNKNYFMIFDATNPPQTDKRSVLSQPSPFSKTLSYGAYAAMLEAADHIGCVSALKKTFPEHWQDIFAAALHSITAENSVAQDMPYWCFHNYCGLSSPLYSSEMSRLYEHISGDPESIPDFMYRFREAYHEAFPDSGLTLVGFDSTNQNTNSHGIELAEYGHPKVKENLPDINTAMFVDEMTGIPLYYEHFYGSLLDKTETPFTMEKVQDLGFRKLFLMMDRGYFSQKAIDSAGEYNFAIMCPETLQMVKQLFKEYSAEIKDSEKYYINEENIYGKRIRNLEVVGNIYNCYIYYDSKRAEDERATIHTKVQLMMKAALSRKRFSKKLQETFSPWLQIEKTERDPNTGRSFTVKESKRHVQQCLDKAGFFVILSNTDLSAADMIMIARMRDSNEKAFRRMKHHFGLSKTYSHSAATYEGKMFIAFVALIIIEAYRYFIKPVLDAVSSTTTASTIGELNKYQIQRKRDGSWMPMYAMTKKQRQILKCLDLTEGKIKTKVSKLRV